MPPRWLDGVLGRPARCACTDDAPDGWARMPVRWHAEDEVDAEAEIRQCPVCLRRWLLYRVQWPHYARSGRWWRVGLRQGEAPSGMAEAKRVIERRDHCEVGGTHFADMGVDRLRAPITIA